MDTGITRIGSFRPWVKKVMPTVYDDTLTYYELLTKTIGYLNQTIDQGNETLDYIEVLKENYEKDYKDFKVDFDKALANQLDLIKENHLEQLSEMKRLKTEFESAKLWLENEALPEAVEERLDIWFDSGKLADIINKDVFDMKADREYVDNYIANIYKDINRQGNRIVDLDRIKATRTELSNKANIKYVDDEIKDVNERVSKIITTPSTGINNEEIIDARNGEDSLGDNIRKIKDKVEPFYKEMVRNAFFTKEDNPRVGNGTYEFTDEGLKITGDGSFRNPAYRRVILYADEYGSNISDSYYINVRMKFFDKANYFQLGFYEEDKTGIDTTRFYGLKENEWMTFSHIYNPSGNYQWTNNMTTEIAVHYFNANDANGKSYVVGRVNAINLTELFGKGNEPSKETLDRVFNYLESNSDNPSASNIIKSQMVYDSKKDTPPFVFGELSKFYPTIEFEDMTIDSPNPLRNYKASEIYYLYDNLWNQYPNRIERNFLGYGEKVGGGNDENAPIYEYIFKPPYTENNVRGEEFRQPLKVLMTTGAHGNEKGTVYTTYKMFEEMMKDEYNPLTPLRLNIEFKILPIVNPTGFDLYKRDSANGVNLNRDFQRSNVNEIKITRDWINRNGDALLIMDLHNTWMDSYGLTYGVSDQKHMLDIYMGVTRTLTFDWYNRYGFGYQDNKTEGYLMSSGGRGHIYYEGKNTTNIKHGILLETSADDFNRIEYTKEVLERTYALTTNYLRAFFNWVNGNSYMR